MKKLLVLNVVDTKAGKKIARAAKKQYETLWGKGSCEVVVLPLEASLSVVADEGLGNMSSLATTEIK
jgi:hypothetical protein